MSNGFRGSGRESLSIEGTARWLERCTRLVGMGRSKKKILLIDESSAGLMVAKMLLGRDAYDVVTARSREDGVQKALVERPDLVVLSATAPSTAGPHAREACEAFRAHDGTGATPILVVTARPARPTLGPAREGCDYVSKPISGLELLTKVRRRLGESRPSRQARQRGEV